MIEDATQLITSASPSASMLPYVSYLLHTTESGYDFRICCLFSYFSRKYNLWKTKKKYV